MIANKVRSTMTEVGAAFYNEEEEGFVGTQDACCFTADDGRERSLDGEESEREEGMKKRTQALLEKIAKFETSDTFRVMRSSE